jgi:hypothetical protein
MRTLSNLDLLQLWERGYDLHPIDRALLTLSAALPQEPHDALADWPLGRRNTALAELRVASFGAKMQGWVACPQCGERLEFEMDAGALRADPDQSEVTFRERRFRLPTSRDLAKIAGEQDPRNAVLRLMQRCCIDARESDEWPEQELDEIGDRLAEADLMAETRVNLRCAQCGEQWDEPLDIAAWLWAEIEARARRLLLEVHMLASAYGWTENEILSLSEPRRAIYLEMVQS